MTTFLDNGGFVDEEVVAKEEETAVEAGEGGKTDLVILTTKTKGDPLSVVKRAISHPSYRILRVVD